VRIDETAEHVSLVLGIRPQNGFRTCPSHPATPFTVTLSEPLGTRTVLDAGFADPASIVGGPVTAPARATSAGVTAETAPAESA
jgi:hypothetical protein